MPDMSKLSPRLQGVILDEIDRIREQERRRDMSPSPSIISKLSDPLAADDDREVIEATFRAAAEEIELLGCQCIGLRHALEESLKLQTHYASILNMHDGGNRMQFATVKSWIDRLASLAPMPKGPAGDAGQVGWMGGEHGR
jgi:hypothetical protein